MKISGKLKIFCRYYGSATRVKNGTVGE